MAKTDLSLKALLPSFAYALDMKDAALYERQRVLVRAGLLKAEAGRGPGSGVRATPRSVAMLLISLVATPSFSEVASCTRAFANLRSSGGPCDLTGERTFGGATTAILTNGAIAKCVNHLRGERGGEEFDAAIDFEDERLKAPPPQKLMNTSWFGKGKAAECKLYTITHLALNFEAVAALLKEHEK